MHMSLYTYAFAQVYCTSSVARSSKGQLLYQTGESTAEQGYQGARAWAQISLTRGAVPCYLSKDRRAGLVTVTRVSQTSPQG